MVRRVMVDPHDSKRVYMATADGLFISVDAGEKWERSGGLLMTGQDTIVLSAGPEPGHFLTGNKRDLWETWDSGETWQIAYFAPIEWDVRWAFFSKHEAGAIWILTSAEILKLAPRDPQTLPPGVVARFRAMAAKEAPVGEVVQTALRRAGVDRPTVNAIRRRAAVASWLPTVTAVAWFRSLDLDHDAIEREASATGSDRTTLVNAYGNRTLNFATWVSWDLAQILHSQNEAPTDRVGGLNRGLEWRIRMTVINLYQERRRLQFEALVNDDTGRPRLLRNLRIEELTAHINALAGEGLPLTPAR